ncbi:hypothetical protein [Streptomyces melanogenes]
MGDQDEGLVDVEPYDPGDGSIPVFRWKQANPATYTAPPAMHLLAA